MRIITMQELTGKPVTVRDLVDGYEELQDGSLRCFGGHLNPRPSYQREFVYSDNDQWKVFKTLYRSFPLGTFYWCEVAPGEYELIDGQQRTLSIINIIHDDIPYDTLGPDGAMRYFSDLPESTRDSILDQELTIYVCKGDLSEKMEWFETINIAGKPLTKQEIRSAVFSGPFVSDARRYFVANGETCQATLNDYGNYIKGNRLRQEILETVLYWHADYEGFKGNKDDMISAYLRAHRADTDALSLWEYYEAAIRWADGLFKDDTHDYTKHQQKVQWGLLYNKYHLNTYSPSQIRKRLDELMSNPEIESKSGIYTFLFDGEVKHLSPRAFKDADKRSKYEEQSHLCAICGGEIDKIDDAHADHIKPWSKGGRTEYSNLQVLCVECNLKKSSEETAEQRANLSVKGDE